MNDDCKKFYLGYKKVCPLSLVFSLFLPTSREVMVNNHLCSHVNWTNVILVSLLSMTYLQITTKKSGNHSGGVTAPGSKNIKFNGSTNDLPMMMTEEPRQLCSV